MTLVRGITEISVPGHYPKPTPAAQIYRALGAQAWDDALRIAERDWKQLLTSGLPAIRALVDIVPSERLDADPRWRRIRAYLQAAPVAGASLTATSRADAVAAVLRLTSEARVARVSGDLLGALALARRAREDFERLPHEHRAALEGDLPHVLFAWGLTEVLAGDATTGFEDLARAYSAARARGDTRLALLAAGELAWLHATEGRVLVRDQWIANAHALLPTAVRRTPEPASLALAETAAAFDRLEYDEARSALARAADAPGEHTVELAWARALLASKDPASDLPRALADLEQLDDALFGDAPSQLSPLTAARAALLLHLGRGETARTLLEDLPSPVLPSIRTIRAAVHLVQGDLDRALHDAQAALHDLGRPRAVVEAWAVIAAVHLRRRDPATEASFRRAVTLADTHGLPSGLTHLPLRDFEALAAFAPPRSPSMLAVGTAGTRRPPAQRTPPPRATPSELAALRLLAAGRSTGETAAAIGVSPNTVKTLTRRLYAKLGVSDRQQLALAAAEHGLL
ncbi:hypothetical protein ASD19_08975 [Microbacterium sp. Root53]|nr:hypothetical protein ASD19_08975 [Microbacterium sp. Root53]